MSVSKKSTRPASIIVAVAENGTIGRQNQLPWKIRSDLQRFKRITMGHALIMGRSTFESIGRVLPGRSTIVLSRSTTFSHPNVQVASSLDEAFSSVPNTMHAFIVGGSQVYRQAFPFVERILLTRILANIPGDATFEDWTRTGWQLTEQKSLPQSEQDEWATRFEVWEKSFDGRIEN